MKKSNWLIVALLTGAIMGPAMGFVPPTDEQIVQVLADHTQLNTLLAGASPEQAAAVVVRVFAELEGASMTEAGRNQAAALLYVRALLLSGENAPKMVGNLAGQINQDVLPVFAASTAIAMGGTEGPVFAAINQAAGAGTEVAAAIASATADPAAVLDADSISLVQQLVIELRGVAAPVIPPPATAPLSLVPPIVPQGVVTPPPPVAATYVNQ